MQHGAPARARMQAAVRKSEDLLREMSGLCDAPEPERQRRRPQDDCRGRLLQVDSLVQRRMEQLPAGDPELKMCRLIRSVCSGAPRSPARRWSVTQA